MCGGKVWTGGRPGSAKTDKVRDSAGRASRLGFWICFNQQITARVCMSHGVPWRFIKTLLAGPVQCVCVSHAVPWRFINTLLAGPVRSLKILSLCHVKANVEIYALHLLPIPQRWATQRQGSVEGGFNGRTNKLVDGCYSFWQGGVFPVLQKLAQQQIVSGGGPPTNKV